MKELVNITLTHKDKPLPGLFTGKESTGHQNDCLKCVFNHQPACGYVPCMSTNKLLGKSLWLHGFETGVYWIKQTTGD